MEKQPITYRDIFDRLDTYHPIAKRHADAGRHSDAKRIRDNINEAKATVQRYCPIDGLDQDVDVRRLARMIYNLINMSSK